MEVQKDGIYGSKPVVNTEGRKTQSLCVKIKSEGTLKACSLTIEQEYRFRNIV